MSTVHRINILLPDGRLAWWLGRDVTSNQAWVWGLRIAAWVAGEPTARVNVEPLGLGTLQAMLDHNDPVISIPPDMAILFYK